MVVATEDLQTSPDPEHKAAGMGAIARALGIGRSSVYKILNGSQ
jgi:DNA-binding phage protein